MNKRIRELMAEADRKCSETRGVYDEILAELIVGECIHIANLGLAPAVADAIKEKFGVESE